VKATELATSFTYTRDHVGSDWLGTPVSYTNRDHALKFLRVVGPDWAMLASGRPQLPADTALPDNLVGAVLGSAYARFAREMVKS